MQIILGLCAVIPDAYWAKLFTTRSWWGFFFWVYGGTKESLPEDVPNGYTMTLSTRDPQRQECWKGKLNPCAKASSVARGRSSLAPCLNPPCPTRFLLNFFLDIQIGVGMARGCEITESTFAQSEACASVGGSCAEKTAGSRIRILSGEDPDRPPLTPRSTPSSLQVIHPICVLCPVACSAPCPPRRADSEP